MNRINEETVNAIRDRSDIVEVISGYRSPATNEALRKAGRGVARTSQHTLGRAIDVRLTDLDTAKLPIDVCDHTHLTRRRGEALEVVVEVIAALQVDIMDLSATPVWGRRS